MVENLGLQSLVMIVAVNRAAAPGSIPSKNLSFFLQGISASAFDVGRPARLIAARLPIGIDHTSIGC